MANVEVALENSPMGTLVPLNKIVRCRWRDEKDSEHKVVEKMELIGKQGFRYNLQGRRLNTVEKLIQYLMVADPAQYDTRKKAEAKAVTMPLDLVEIWVGHHRRESCRRLGTWFIWGLEHLGKRDLIPCVLKDDAPEEEARDIYLTDNQRIDEQTCGWAIGNVRKMLPDLIASGMVTSQAKDYLANRMCLGNVRAIDKLADIDQGIRDGIASEAIKELNVQNGVEMWKLLSQHPKLVPFEMQKEMVDESFKSDNPRKSIGNYFSKLRAELPEPAKVVVPKTKQPAAVVQLKLIEKLAESFRQTRKDEYEYSEQELLFITERMQYLNSVAPTVDLAGQLAEQLEIQRTNAAAYAAMEEEEQYEESNDQKTDSARVSTAV